MNATLKDISERTGVSKSVISMYLNKDPRVRLGEAKKKLIDAAVREMNYHPSHMACSLRKGKSALLGLVVGGISDPFFSRLAEACLKYVEARGYQLLISLTSWDVKKEKKCLEMLLDRQVDGVIYAPRFPDDKVFQDRVMSYGIPIVLMNRQVPGMPAVYQDPRKAYDVMARMFREMGCRKLPIISYENELNSEYFKEACEKYGIRPDVMIFESDKEVVERILQKRNPFLYIPSCWIARDALNAIRERNLDYHPVFTTGYSFPIDLISDEGMAGVIYGHAYLYMKNVVDLLIDRIENAGKNDAEEPPLRLIDVTFHPREEFFRIKDTFQDTIEKTEH